MPGLAFTRDGLEPILQSARTIICSEPFTAACGKPDEAKARFEAAASPPHRTRFAGHGWLPSNYPVSIRRNGKLACRLLSNRQPAAAKPVHFQAGGCTPPVRWRKELGNNEEAETRFRNALLLPDRMLAYHLTRLAKTEATP